MKRSICSLIALLFISWTCFAVARPVSSNNARPTAEKPAAQPAITYPTDPDSLAQDGVPRGKLEGPILFRSQIFTNTIRKYWIYVPAQYTSEKPACVLVFQDGQRATRANGALRLPQVMENLIAKKQMPVTIGIFIT